MTPTRKNLVGVQVTLPLADTNYNLFTLLSAVDPECPAAAKDLTIQYDKDNTVDVLVGDANLAAGRFGYRLDSTSGGKVYARSSRDFPVSLVWVRAVGAANQKLNVEVVA